MKYLKYFYQIPIFILVLASSCKKELDVKNPNAPVPADAQTETGIISLATGAIYTDGFNGVDLSTLNWLGSSFFSLCYGYQELLADDISAIASNQAINTINLPEYAILDDGTKLTSSTTQKQLLRISNARSARGSNPFYYEWAYMYAINRACNNLLILLPDVVFSGDADTKANTIKAWAYWWKGYAYSRIGSLYYSGITNDTIITTNNHYIIHDEIIAEANKNFDIAENLLNSVSNLRDYNDVLSRIIPDFLQQGNGGVLTPDMWIHNINTMRARNLLLNKRLSEMTSTDWNSILSFTNNGIQENDYVFTARTAIENGFLSASSGSVAAMSTNTNGTFTISERLIQEYYPGDKRFDNNFKERSTAVLNQAGGFTFSTRWYLVDGGNGLSGVAVLSDRTPGDYELYIAGNYEENALMQAEAKINTGNVVEGLMLIDQERDYQGAGLALLAGTGLSQAEAEEVLRRERRVALVFRGVAFYDYRRFEFTYDISQGGGRINAVVLTSSGDLNTDATINYNFLDYWDVPADEVDLNPPDETSAPVVNPN